MSKQPFPIEPLFQFWKNQFLPLKDWNIQYDFRRYSEMEGDHGCVTVTEVKRCAFIRLLDPRDADPNEMEPYDVELTLVHELLHVCLAPFMRNDISEHQDIIQEQSVHALSIALVNMRRNWKPGNAVRRRSAPIELEEKAA